MNPQMYDGSFTVTVAVHASVSESSYVTRGVAAFAPSSLQSNVTLGP